MLKFELAKNVKHSIILVLKRKNLGFLRRTNLIKNRYQQFDYKKNAK